MDLPKQYELFLASPSEFAPSIVMGLLPEDTPEPDVAGMQRRLQEAGLGRLRFEVASDPRQHGAVWRQAVVVALEGREEPARFHVSLNQIAGNPPPLEHSSWLSDEERAAGERSQWGISVEMPFGDEPLRDYHEQLRILATAAPEAVVVMDAASTAVRPGAWAREVASSSVPPSPLALFQVDAVAPDEGGNHWLHTHGLLRCGLVEIEMLDIPAEATGAVAQLINAVTSRFMDLGLPPPGETFEAGLGLELVWLPWEEGIKHAPQGLWTGADDRGPGHQLPCGVLFRPPSGLLRKRYGNPADYAGVLEENPLVWISGSETKRMAALARERLHRFAALQQRFGADEESWVFLVKLGLSVDRPLEEGGEEPTLEHLWFQVHALTGNQMDATLLNQPYGIANLNEGNRARWSLDPMSDWSIMCERGRFGPDTIGQLERRLEESS